MKIIFAVILILLSGLTVASENMMGLGVMVGNPTGINGKYWLDEQVAVDGGLGYSIGKHADFSLHSDYLLHKKGAFFLNDVHALDLYYGLGGRMEFADDIQIGVRVPVGLAHEFKDQPADMFAEIAPVVDFVSTIGVEIHLAFGARYYF